MRTIRLSVIGILVAATSALPAHAKVIKSAPDHFTLKHEAISTLPPKAVWKKLINPAKWWHPDHSYSGSSKNMSIKAKAGGQWKEVWPGGSVIHGEILYIKPGEQMRLSAPFGPLQEMAVTDIWTITITPHEDGSKIVFDEIANGTSASKLDELAKAVDFVKEEAIQRLAASTLPN